MTNQDQMWMPTQDDAVEIYARYLMGRHGKSAHRYARKTADKLKREGDLEGYSLEPCGRRSRAHSREEQQCHARIVKAVWRSGIAKADRTQGLQALLE